MSISTSVKGIQDIMRKDAGVDGDAQRIGQLAWMLFLKIYDDREKEREEIDPDFKSIIPEKLRWRNWAANSEGITGEELLKFINNELFPELKELEFDGAEEPMGYIIRDVFQDAFNYMKNGTLIRQVINTIQKNIDFNRKADRHVFNDIYEKLLKDLQSAGNAGEFYTPRGVTQFMTDMVDPKLGEKILDPACGTGGFLVCSIENIRGKYVNSVEDERLLQKSINGVEVKQLPHVLAVTNMLLHGIDIPSQIKHDDALSRPLRDYEQKDRVDVVLTNPPFGGSMVDGTEMNFPADLRTKETADLFMIFIMHILKDGARAGVVLPDTILFKEDGVKQRIKEKLLTECNLHTIVRLPNSVFQPYASIATNLLFFTKGKKTKEVWFYEHPLPEGYKAYSKTKTIQIEEFEPEKEWWNNRKETRYAWKVTIDEIKAKNWSLEFENPNKPKEVIRDPMEVLEEYNEKKKTLKETKDKLKAELQKSIGGK
jgi:type I restriction enzyme M protein